MQARERISISSSAIYLCSFTSHEQSLLESEHMGIIRVCAIMHN